MNSLDQHIIIEAHINMWREADIGKRKLKFSNDFKKIIMQ